MAYSAKAYLDVESVDTPSIGDKIKISPIILSKGGFQRKGDVIQIGFLLIFILRSLFKMT